MAILYRLCLLSMMVATVASQSSVSDVGIASTQAEDSISVTPTPSQAQGAASVTPSSSQAQVVAASVTPSSSQAQVVAASVTPASSQAQVAASVAASVIPTPSLSQGGASVVATSSQADVVSVSPTTSQGQVATSVISTITPPTDACASKSCPAASTCINTKNGAVCQCSTGRYLAQNKCAKMEKVLKVKNLKLDVPYKAAYANKTSPEYGAITATIESAITKALQEDNPAVVGTKVTELRKGSLIVDFLVILNATMTFTGKNSLVSTIYAAAKANNNKLGSLTITDYKPLTIADLEACALLKVRCGKYEECINKGLMKYACECEADYRRDSDNKCYDHEEHVVEVVVPIFAVVALLVVLVTVYVLFGRRKSSSSSPAKTTTSFDNTAYGK